MQHTHQNKMELIEDSLLANITGGVAEALCIIDECYPRCEGCVCAADSL